MCLVEMVCSIDWMLFYAVMLQQDNLVKIYLVVCMKQQCIAHHFSSAGPKAQVFVVKVVNFSQFLLLKNQRANFNQTWHSWVMGIQVCSNDGPFPFPRGNDNEIAQIY